MAKESYERAQELFRNNGNYKYIIKYFSIMNLIKIIF